MNISQTIATLLLSFVACQAAEPLSVARLQKIISADHDDTKLVGALRIYPEAGVYELRITVQINGGESLEVKTSTTKKWIDGRYIVSEVQAPGAETKVAIVVEFDEDESLYRRYIVADSRLSGYQVGARIGDSRSVSWIDLSPAKLEAGFNDLTTETHTDNQTTWRSVLFQSGKLQRIKTGVEVSVK